MDKVFPNVNREKIDAFYKKIGQNVKKAREKRGMSQLELAILIGHRTTSFLSNCENYKNKNHFNLEHLYLIADVLKVDIVDLIK